MIACSSATAEGGRHAGKMTSTERHNERLAGSGVIVTGAAGTIGVEVCKVLLEEGARLAITDLAEDPLCNAVEALGSTGVAYFRRADVASLDDMTAFVSDARQKLERISVLVNVAGRFVIEEFVSTGEQEWSATIAANLLTAMVACRAVLPTMLDIGHGSIVNFASTAGEFGSIRPSAAYAAAKGGVIGFTKSLAREVSPRGVRVNAISPGPIDTPALQASSPDQRNAAAARTLLGRVGAPSDIAHGVLFLASEASAFVTGTVLQVNGGSLL